MNKQVSAILMRAGDNQAASGINVSIGLRRPRRARFPARLARLSGKLGNESTRRRQGDFRSIKVARIAGQTSPNGNVNQRETFGKRIFFGSRARDKRAEFDSHGG